jgi:predicted permease
MTSGVAGDVRFALRSLRATPAVTLAAVLTLALGIGATTAIFSVANAALLRRLPVKDPERLATITSETALRFGFQAGAGWNYSMWDQLRQRADAFDGAFAWLVQRVDLSEGGAMQPIEMLVASGEFFSTLGVHAAVGRTFTSADDGRGGGADGGVVVLSHDYWQRRYGGAAGVVGSQITIEGTPLTIVGVAPRGFRGVDVGTPFDIAMPFGAEALVRGRRSIVEARRALLLTIMLRLKTGQSVSQATAALRAMQPQIVGSDAPQFVKEPFVVVAADKGVSDRSQLRQRYERPLVMLAIVSGLVLVIVCVNIANLMLARASARRRELSIRLAVGAPRWRLARQPLIEGAMVGSAGVLAGVLLAAGAGRALVAQLPASDRPIQIDLPIDGRVFLFAMAITAIAVALFAIVPALYAARVPPLEALQDDGRAASGGRTAVLSSALIVPQVALSIVLLAAAGLFVRTLDRLASVPLGFDPKGVLVVTVNAGRSPGDPAARVQLFERLREAVAAVPGVTHAAGSIWTPIGTGGGGVLSDARGRRGDVGPQVAYNFVTAGWFATYRTAMHGGRDFDARDYGDPRVAIVNESFRRGVLQGRAALGETTDAGPCARGGCTIVGVVADTVYGRSLRDRPPPTVYLPLGQGDELLRDTFRLSVQAAGDFAHVVPGIGTALRGVDPRLTYTFVPLEEEVGKAVAQERLVARLAGFFGLVGILLCAVGLYGICSHAVTRRRTEIGVRLALGGQPAAVVRLVLARIAALVSIGALAGMLMAAWLSRFVAPLLYGLQPRDPVTLTAATVTLAAVAALAGWIPASRAARVDPAQVLREH